LDLKLGILPGRPKFLKGLGPQNWEPKDWIGLQELPLSGGISPVEGQGVNWTTTRDFFDLNGSLRVRGPWVLDHNLIRGPHFKEAFKG